MFYSKSISLEYTDFKSARIHLKMLNEIENFTRTEEKDLKIAKIRIHMEFISKEMEYSQWWIDHMSFVAIWKCNVLRFLWITDFFFLFKLSIRQCISECVLHMGFCRMGTAWNLIDSYIWIRSGCIQRHSLRIFFLCGQIQENFGKGIAWGRN